MQATQKTIRLLVADNTRMYTQLLAGALSHDPQLKVVAWTSNGQDTTQATKEHAVDILVLGCNLDEQPLGGIALLRELKAIRPAMKAIVLLDSSKRETVLEAFRAGARGLFSRHESLETLCKCVHQVHAGQIWANSEQMSYAVEALASAPQVRAVDANGLELLSKRELEVVHSLAEGLTNREIAERLGLSQHTIKNYLFRIFDKLGVSSRTELLFLTLKNPRPANGESAASRNAHTAPENVVRQGESSDEVQAALLAARMYEIGDGAPLDLVSAYMWYSLAEMTTVQGQESIRESKRRLSEVLTPGQILEAQNKLRDYQKKPGKAESAASGMRSASPLLA